MKLGKRPAVLSITHNFRSDEETQLDIGHSGRTSLHDFIAGGRIARTGEIASKSGDLGQVYGNRFSWWTLRSFVFHQLIEQADFRCDKCQCERSIQRQAVHHGQPENPPAENTRDRYQIG
jgi:hypothetical protein